MTRSLGAAGNSAESATTTEHVCVLVANIAPEARDKISSYLSVTSFPRTEGSKQSEALSAALTRCAVLARIPTRTSGKAVLAGGRTKEGKLLLDSASSGISHVVAPSSMISVLDSPRFKLCEAE